jgi:amino acid adenylation domain-containing protein
VATVAELCDRAAVAWPQRIAVVAGDTQVTYRTLNRRAEARAAQLCALGCGAGDVVGVCVERSVELIAALLAVWKAGGAFLPLDPHLPAARNRAMLEAARAQIVLCGTRQAALFTGLAARVLDVDAPAPALQRRAGASAPDPAASAYVIFTSGSTGRPKGVAIAHASFARYVTWAVDAYGLEPGGVSVVHTSIAFDLTLTSIFCPLVLGAPMALVPETDGPEGLARWLDTRRSPVGLLKMTPSHLALANAWRAGRGSQWEHCGVLILGGEALPAGEVRRWSHHDPGTRIFNEYGPTEATVGCCVAEVTRAQADAHGSLPIGVAIEGTTLAVGASFPPGSVDAEEGELLIGGACLALGYLHDPRATAEKFVPDARAVGARRYRSGDHVRPARGAAGLTFVGRHDRQVKLRGFRVELGEIEACLATCPGVRAALVTSSPTERGDAVLLRAFLVVDDADRGLLERSTVERFLRERLIAAAVPTEFHLLRELPLAPSGKVDLERLEREAPGMPRLVERFCPPRNPTEELLASLWRRVLGVEGFGIDDSFFGLDGNSMKSIQFAYLAKRSGLALTTRDLFEHQTIRALAALVDAGAAWGVAEPPPAAFAQPSERDRARLPADVEDAYPLAFLQAGTLFESNWDPESGTYHNVNSYHLEGALDVDLLRESLRLLVPRHPILRTAYDFGAYQEPLQLVWRTSEVPLHVETLRAREPAQQEAELAAFIRDESRRPFDWTRPPLLRFFVHERGHRSFQLTLSKHHSILDGWSAATLIAELVENYLALARGLTPPRSAPVETRFGDFVALERAALASPESRSFWLETLSGAPRTRLRPWPGNRPQASGGCSSATFRNVALPAGTAEALKRAATRAQTPLKNVLLAAHLRVLSRMTGALDVVTGVVSHGRPETGDADRALGLFINTLPHRARLDPRQTWLELAGSTFDEERRVFPHRRYAMARIRKDLGAAPFDSIFYFTDFHVFRGLRDSDGLRCVGSAGFEETEIPFTAAFSLHPLTGAVSLRLHFHVEHFSVEQIDTVVGWFQSALWAVAERPEEPVDALTLAGGAEPKPARAEPRLVAEAPDAFAGFVTQARTQGDAIALVSPRGQVSHRYLLRWAKRVAAELHARGAGPGSTVLLGLADTAEAIAGLLGVACAGACAVVVDPQWPDERLRELTSQVAPAAFLVDEDVRRRLPFAEARSVRFDALSSTERVPIVVPPRTLAYIVFTSGSTGRPKGVMVSRDSLAHSTRARLQHYGDTPYRRFLLLSRLTFDSAYAGLWGTLVGGGTLILTADEAVLDVGAAARVLTQEQVTHLLAVPALHRALLHELAGQQLALETVIVAGEELKRDLVAAHHAALPGVRLFNEYGPSEVTVWASVAELTDGDERTGAAVSIGPPLAHVSAHVLDPRLTPVAPGVAGELYLGGPAVAQGYLGAPAATAERFLPNPFDSSAGAILYRSGDVVRAAPDGALEFVGRADNQLKVRGFRVEPEELEALFQQSFPGREALVRARRVGAAVVGLSLCFVPLDERDPLDLNRLRAVLGRRVPTHALPDELIAVTSLPRLRNGKLDRKAVLETKTLVGRVVNDRPPASDLERALALLWQEALAVPELSVTQSFFELGGDSLLANRVVLKTDRVFGVRLRLKEFYETPTVAAQAALISQRARGLGIDVERVASIWNQLE